MTEIEYRRLDLPLDAVEPKVRGLIEGGGGMLSSEIIRQWSVSAIWTGAGPRTHTGDLIEVARGGLPEPSRLNPLVIAFISQFLREDGRRVALFEDAVARPGDAVLARAKSPYVVIDDHVFPVLRGDHVDDAAVTDLLLDAWSWRLVGLLTSSEALLTGDHFGTDLADLVANSQHVVVGAWDGEGILVLDRMSPRGAG